VPLIDQITQPTRRSRASFRAILKAYAERLRQLPQFGGSVFISDQVVPAQMPLGRHGISVSFGSGFFGQQWIGGSHQTAATESTVVIGLFRQAVLDRSGRSEAAIVEDASLLAMFEAVLAALTVADPSKGKLSQTWEPSHLGVPLLKSIPTPSGFSEAADVPGHTGWIGMHLSFAVEFDWDLYPGQTEGNAQTGIGFMAIGSTFIVS
jgi:hypothetical protein